MSQATLAAEKSALREACRARRLAIAPDAAAAAAEAVALEVEKLVAGLVDVRPGIVVSAYWPLEGELDPRPALGTLAARGATPALPRVIGDGQPLAFHRWQADDRLIEGRFKVMEPDPAMPVLPPSVLLVPLLAFDGNCRRLGHGKGYYDRTLAGLRAAHPDILAVGLAFAAQEVDCVPTNAFDQSLDLVITERAVHRAGAAR